MQAPPSSPNSGHNTSEMYYTNILFGHPLLSASALVNRTTEQTIQDPVIAEELPVSNDDFIELDVHSDYASNQSDDDESVQLEVDLQPVASSSQVPTVSTHEPTLEHAFSGLDIKNQSSFEVVSVSRNMDLSSSNDEGSAFYRSSPESPVQLLPQLSSNSSYSPPIPTSSTDCDVFLMPQHDIAPGNSITSTVVNLLRGCNLLDSYSLEDLCNYLPILRTIPPFASSTNVPHPPPAPPPQPSRRQQIQKKSSSLPSRLPLFTETSSASQPQVQHSRLVDYLLTCSRLGSTALVDFSPTPGGGNSLLPPDLRRGRSDGLVCVVSGAAGTVAAAGRLAGRFVTDWRRAAPAGLEASTDDEADDLVAWLTAWMRLGAVIFFAQLDTPVVESTMSSNGKPRRCKGEGGGCCELTWRHRLVFGVSGKKCIHLSNPIETVTVASLLEALNEETTICVPKSDLLKLWNSYEVMAQKPSCDGLASSGSEQDLSPLAKHEDPRWRQLNVLGQVISTLREQDAYLERCATVDVTASPSRLTPVAQESLRCEPHLRIPCAQRPGFSLFVLASSTALDNRASVT